MSILVTGTIGLDTIETPFGKVEEALGGSASYFALAASLYSSVSIVSVVGDDFPVDCQELLAQPRIDLSGVSRLPGETFRWGGRYPDDLNNRETLFTNLNVLTEFKPSLSIVNQSCPYVFLANLDPELQAAVLDQVQQPRLTMLDTMNIWIDHCRDLLTEVMRRVDVVLINDEEARQYTGEVTVAKAADSILSLGPRFVVIKRGEYGAVLVGDGDYFFLPGYPVEEPRDPTGAGDSFAGGMLGYLSNVEDWSAASIRRALVHGSVVASFAVEQFSVGALIDLTAEKIRKRFAQYKQMTYFEEGEENF